jgi:N-acetylglucosamine kinase-like BadF-type ATPase
MERLAIGVDGGGSETLGILVTEHGTILAQAKAGPTNYQAVGGPKLKLELEKLFQLLGVGQNLKTKRVDQIYLGLAGAGRESDKKEILALFSNNDYAVRIAVESDAMIALAGAFSGSEGIILIAGTGAICFGKNKTGPVVRSGGWGYLLGDEGSGFFIGQQAIIAALKDLDGRGEKTRLREELERRYQLAQIDLIIPKIYKQEIDRVEISRLAPLVFELAVDNDLAAADIIRRTGHEQGKMVKAVAEKLELLNKKIHVALIGGIFHQREILENEIAKELYELSWDVEIIDPDFPPAVGAAIMALKELRIDISESIINNLHQTELIEK